METQDNSELLLIRKLKNQDSANDEFNLVISLDDAQEPPDERNDPEEGKGLELSRGLKKGDQEEIGEDR